MLFRSESNGSFFHRGGYEPTHAFKLSTGRWPIVEPHDGNAHGSVANLERDVAGKRKRIELRREVRGALPVPVRG